MIAKQTRVRITYAVAVPLRGPAETLSEIFSATGKTGCNDDSQICHSEVRTSWHMQAFCISAANLPTKIDAVCSQLQLFHAQIQLSTFLRRVELQYFINSATMHLAMRVARCSAS